MRGFNTTKFFPRQYRFVFEDGRSFPVQMEGRIEAALTYGGSRGNVTANLTDDAQGDGDGMWTEEGRVEGFPPSLQMRTPIEEGIPPTDGAKVVYPLDDALASVSEDPTLVEHHAWRATHPEAVLVGAWLAPDPLGHRWILIWQDGTSFSAVLSRHTEAGVVQNEEIDEPREAHTGGLELSPDRIDGSSVAPLADIVDDYLARTRSEGPVEYAAWTIYDTAEHIKYPNQDFRHARHAIVPCWTVGEAVVENGQSRPVSAFSYEVAQGHLSAMVEGDGPVPQAGDRDVRLAGCDGVTLFGFYDGS